MHHLTLMRHVLKLMYHLLTLMRHLLTLMHHSLNLMSLFHIHRLPPRLRDCASAQRKAEERVRELETVVSTRTKSNQTLVDEHQALQMAFDRQEEKQRELEKENDRLVGVVCGRGLTLLVCKYVTVYEY